MTFISLSFIVVMIRRSWLCGFVVCFRRNLLSLDLDLDLCIWRMRHAQAAFKENDWA